MPRLSIKILAVGVRFGVCVFNDFFLLLLTRVLKRIDLTIIRPYFDNSFPLVRVNTPRFVKTALYIHTKDVSKCKEMAYTFSGAESFNQDLGRWNVGKVETMEGMFAGAFAFNGDVSTWDVSNVMNMDAVFAEATSFNRDLSAWGTSCGGLVWCVSLFIDVVVVITTRTE
jgi:surface protein